VLAQFVFEMVAKFDQQLDIECGIHKPRLGQWSGRPIRRRMFFRQRNLQFGFEQVAKAHAFASQQSPRMFGVEQQRWLEPQLDKTTQILRAGMQDPFGGLHHFRQR